MVTPLDIFLFPEVVVAPDFVPVFNLMTVGLRSSSPNSGWRPRATPLGGCSACCVTDPNLPENQNTGDSGSARDTRGAGAGDVDTVADHRLSG